jgi:hypothetical protein
MQKTEIAYAMAKQVTGLHCRNRVFEWTMAVILLLIAAWLVVWPTAMSDNSFRHIYDVVGPEFVWIYLFIVGSFRTAALWLNGAIPKWGPRMRAVGSVAGAVVWLQFAASLLVNAMYHDIAPSISVVVYAGLAFSELRAAKRARSDANGLD